MVDSSDHGDAAEEMPKEENGHAGEPVDSAACPIESKTGPEEAQPLKPRSWKWQVVFLCFYGFMVQLKPGEAFITPLLLSVEKNFTREQVTNEIIPVLTYSYMAVLVPVFLLTDWLRYKPVLVLQSISYVSIWLILLLGTSLIEMQFMEFFYGITMAARVAYSSYIFSLVPASVYQRVASYSRSSVLLGVFTSSVMGQLCLARGLVTYSTLSIISLGFVSIGLLLSLCLPWPKRSLFFNLTPASANASNQSELERMRPDQAGKSLVPAARREPSWRDSVFVQMLLELRNVTRVPSLRLWSLWWVFNSAGYYLVVFNVPILWNTVYSVTENTKVHNGYVEAVATLFGAATSFTAGFVKIRWKVWSELVIGVITASQAALLLLMGTTENIWVCYTAYAFFRGFYQFLVPIAIFQIASSLTKELCALVFGVNTFLSTILKTIISIIVADKRGLTLAVHSQFFVYFFYFAFLTVIYLACAAWVITHHYRRQGRPTQEATPRELTPIEGYAVEVEPLSSSSAVKA